VTAERAEESLFVAHVADGPKCDARLKEFKATVRCIPLVDEYDGPGKCIITGSPTVHRAVIAKA
jgi:prolyl-tRNA synthetase